MNNQQVTHESTPPHILVVDDGVDTLLLLKLGLRRAGYEVSEARTGKDALQLVQENGPPQLVILDILLPDMNGFAVAKEIIFLSNVPIIFLSALCDTKTKLEALSLYGKDYVTKPFSLEELLCRIHHVLMRALTDLPPTAPTLLSTACQRCL
ncbi:MAG: response regulator transcription factor [Caldilineaceae bacterium]|nr:response regulator transcription factor [Caldilineaceae bacterium]